MTFSLEVNYEISLSRYVIEFNLNKILDNNIARPWRGCILYQSLKYTKMIFQNYLQGPHLSELVIICENTTAEKSVRRFVYEGC